MLPFPKCALGFCVKTACFQREACCFGFCGTLSAPSTVDPVVMWWWPCWQTLGSAGAGRAGISSIAQSGISVSGVFSFDGVFPTLQS